MLLEKNLQKIKHTGRSTTTGAGLGGGIMTSISSSLSSDILQSILKWPSWPHLPQILLLGQFFFSWPFWAHLVQTSSLGQCFLACPDFPHSWQVKLGQLRVGWLEVPISWHTWQVYKFLFVEVVTWFSILCKNSWQQHTLTNKIVKILFFGHFWGYAFQGKKIFLAASRDPTIP